MNDFFTDLDSDILRTKTPPASAIKPTPIHSSVPRQREARVNDVHGRGGHAQNRQREPIVSQRNAQEKKTINPPGNHVTEMRNQMMQAGVVVMVFKVDEKSRALLGHLKLETRGFAFVEEVRELHKIVIKKARASYEDTVKDVPDIEEKDLLKIIRRDMEIFLQNKIDRIPVIIPIILYI